MELLRCDLTEAEADRDGDGKISYAEYHAWFVPRLAELSIDLLDILKPEG
ncbi:MAG: hypothetical protein SXU28_11080 [Pseudomonadota bacterium]|nr:hypothetical protein [Pseudomonadota bacterium]